MNDSLRPQHDAITFGPFCLMPGRRRLEKAGSVIELGGRALDLLIALAEHPGEVVSKRELISRVWPDVIVSEGSLRFHINALRKALADLDPKTTYIKNIVRRGYCFVSPVTYKDVPVPSAPGPSTDQANDQGSLPVRRSPTIGRQETIQELVKLLTDTRFVTITGPGGMGKTTVAIGVSHALLDEFEYVRFVDVGALTDGRLLASAVASALGLLVSSADPSANLVAFLRAKRTLLVLDGCERIIESVAVLAERVRAECPQSAILATSRESLRVDGENVYPLAPLSMPPEEGELHVEDALKYASVELFVARARAASPQFELQESEVAVLASMCRRLGGIPLAIELAAGRIATLGLKTTAELLDSRFALKWPGRRTSPPRHRTLGDTLDWSVELLSEQERAVLRRLSVFAGGFSLAAAQSVASGSGIDELQVAQFVSNLVEKSLVSSTPRPIATVFRLLDTTRAYAGEMLEQSGEQPSVALRHALFMCEFLERTWAGSNQYIRGETWRAHAAYLSNLRAALEWTGSRPEQRELMTKLAAAAGPFLLDLSLLGECLHWVKVGLAALEESQLGTAREMVLQATYGLALLFSKGSVEEARVALHRALLLAEVSHDPYNQMRVLGALNSYHQRKGELRDALTMAERAAAIAQQLNDPACTAMAGWLSGISLHLIGDQRQAQRFGPMAWTEPPRSQIVNRVRFGFDDHRIRGLCGWTRVLWLLGYADQACVTAYRVIDEAARMGHPIALAIAWVWVTPVLLWSGDHAGTRNETAKLIAHAEQHALGPYKEIGRGILGQLAVETGDAAAGLEMLSAFHELLRAQRYGLLLAIFSAPLAQALASLGRMQEALAAIEFARVRMEQDGGSYDMAELLRIKANLLVAIQGPAAPEAEQLLQRSLEVARSQAALAWELRTTMSLARLRLQQGRAAEVRPQLQSVFERFSEGARTTDLIAARKLLDELSGTPHPAQ